MAEHRGGDTTSARATAIRALLNEWDFIGVVPHGVRDEYDCLILELGEHLDRGAGADEVQAYLSAELVTHFGLSGGRTPAGDEFVVGLLALGT
ncbi:hypothetical protein PSU4_35610 [Pseudonocardia sulfidoxydans NBRC 16205]|uniref:DUF1871 domain-containing protein n=1 Tax=Pseudonocardia sulfidoxydans NBRC 16205 TaxID=1223511 RepID=A0A511DJK9_9PSEU|nr:hypothetical protein [Pseudonocardia sulfidoxydans]GEL24607.1 hypothetical protein PSU4_35610 [Pseudonocardia sulfidoxydans NBRC 16205]